MSTEKNSFSGKQDSPDTLPAVAPASDDPFEEGASIGQVWIVEAPLGKGGMGSVYRCHNRHAPKIIAAVKLLDPFFQFHPEARSRFLREAEILSTVDHPNVVRVSSVNLESTPPFLAMDFVEGDSLEEVLATQGAFDAATGVDLTKQLVDALRYLHLKRIYHRDIKPANLLITPNGSIRVVDFGLAVQKGARAVTLATKVDFGTVSYCPPEWGSDQVIEPVLWDLYSTGVVLYEMLTGTVAFPSSSDLPAAQQILQVLAKKRRLPNLDIGPSFEPALRAVVRRLTERDPENRYLDAKAVLADLESLDPDWTVADAPRPATEPPAARLVRPPVVSGVGMAKWAGLASLLALGAIVVGFFIIGLLLVVLLMT